MHIGPYEIKTIETGYVSLDGGAMFGVVPKPLWSKTNPADEQNRIILSMRLLIIKSKDRLMITDTGVGNKMNEKLSKIYNVDHSKFNLESSLKAAGYNPEYFTDVLITHLHFDHIGGATYYDENNTLNLTFPNAIHHVQKKHWEWALNPSDRDRASFMPENYMPIKESDKLNLVDGPGELFPGIYLHTFNGHTPSMQGFRITDGKNTLFYPTDLIPMASHLPLPYIMGYDLQPLSTLKEKKEILPQALEENWLFVFEHDPYNMGGKIELTDRGYKLAEKIDSI